MKVAIINSRKLTLIEGRAERMKLLNRKKKTILVEPPKHITVGVSSACNNKCLFCSYHGNDAKGRSNVYNLPFMLSLEKFIQICDMAYRGGTFIYAAPGNLF